MRGASMLRSLPTSLDSYSMRFGNTVRLMATTFATATILTMPSLVKIYTAKFTVNAAEFRCIK
jgi:hypothetical protein